MSLFILVVIFSVLAGATVLALTEERKYKEWEEDDWR